MAICRRQWRVLKEGLKVAAAAAAVAVAVAVVVATTK